MKVNYSKQFYDYKRKLKKEKIIVKVCQIGLLVLLLGLWELLTYVGVADAFFTSSPSRIFIQLWDLVKTGTLFYHMAVTLGETIAGFILATGIGTLIAIALWWSERLRRVLDPYIVVLNSLPKIALGPLIIIWVGAGTRAILTMCILICVVITILSMLSAFLNCEKDKIQMVKSMGATKWQLFQKLVLPASRNEFISVLKINVGMSWVGTIMGEYLVSKAGLGYLITYGSQVFKLDLVMASTLVLCLLACLMYYVVEKISNKLKS